MIKRIISGGQTGADRAALDAAIKLGIPHGGWAPRGRRAEDGVIPPVYRLQETSSPAYSERTEKNVLEADGTLIISRGPLTGGSDLTRKLSEKHQKPLLHIDFADTAKFGAALGINAWIAKYAIEVLNVAGPRASKDPKIYQIVRDILETVLYLIQVDEHLAESPHPQSRPPQIYAPQSVDEAVERILATLSLKSKSFIARLERANLHAIESSVGQYVRSNFGIRGGNPELMRSCALLAGKDTLDEDGVTEVIIEQLWRKLRKTHGLRLVKG